MKKNILKKSTATIACLVALTVALCACGNSQDTQANASNSFEATEGIDESSASSESSDTGASESSTTAATALEVSFGDEGEPFIMNLYDNDTAKAIAEYVGTADWRLPIYNYEDYENWEIMQYYDIPSRYEIPANPETITTVKTGEVYYSDPNRIVLFYQDGEVSGEYTSIGYFDPTEEFVAAVSNNPVLEGWSNKIVLIGAAD